MFFQQGISFRVAERDFWFTKEKKIQKIIVEAIEMSFKASVLNRN